MKKIKNIVEHNPEAGTYGDCHRACFCTILGLEPEDVPHFYHDGPAGDGGIADQRIADFLDARGLVQGHVLFAADANPLENILYSCGHLMPGVPLILGGVSAKGCGHSVVLLDGEIFNDPTGSGIIGPFRDGFYWVTFFSPKPAAVA